MPREVEEALARRADENGLKGKRRDRYIYGTMNRLGLMPPPKKKRKVKKQK